MTIIGFAMSIMFIMFVFSRLLCVRLNSRRLQATGINGEFGMLERGINGMEPTVVATLPTVKYNHDLFTSREDALCTICLGEYQGKDILRILPICEHNFHINCIDLWLRQNSTCPVCRVSLQDSDDKRIPSLPLNTELQSSYSSGTISSGISEHSYASLNGNRVQLTHCVQGQEQPLMSLASEAYQNGREEDKVDELTLERCFHDIASNENREQNLCSVQLNVAGNSCAPLVSQVLVQSLIDGGSLSHSLLPCIGLEEGCMVAGHSTEFQCGQGSVSVQNDNIKAVGIISGFQVQQGLNVGSPDYMFERSSHIDGFHMGFMACGVIENVLSSSVRGNYMRDSIASMDVWGRGVTASSSSFPVIKTKSGNALDENLCEHKVIGSMVDGTASDGSSLRAHPLGQCKDSCTIPGSSLFLASEETIYRTDLKNMSASSDEICEDVPEKLCSGTAQISEDLICVKGRQDIC